MYPVIADVPNQKQPKCNIKMLIFGVCLLNNNKRTHIKLQVKPMLMMMMLLLFRLLVAGCCIVLERSDADF